jgi:hypothetical protein
MTNYIMINFGSLYQPKKGLKCWSMKVHRVVDLDWIKVEVKQGLIGNNMSPMQ